MREVTEKGIEDSVWIDCYRYLDLTSQVVSEEESNSSSANEIQSLEEEKHAIHNQISLSVGSRSAATTMIALAEASRHTTDKAEQVASALYERLGMRFPVFYGTTPFYYGGGVSLEQVYPDKAHTVIINLVNTTWEYSPSQLIVGEGGYENLINKLYLIGTNLLNKQGDKFKGIRIVRWLANMHTPNETLDVAFGDSPDAILKGVDFLLDFVDGLKLISEPDLFKCFKFIVEGSDDYMKRERG